MKISKMSVKVLAGAALALLSVSCSHAQLDQQIDGKLAQTPEIKDSAMLHTDVIQEIKRSDIPADEKSRLIDLSEQTHKQLDDLRERSRKLRALLVQEMTDSNYNSDEADRIKARLKEAENDRLSLIFKFFDQANTILGHLAPKHAAVLNDMFEPRAHAQ